MANKTILIADDMEDIRENIMITLGEDDFNFLQAASGEEALKLIMEKSVELVIADIAMPGGNGLELCQNLKKLAKRPKIMLLTGYASMFDSHEAKPDAIMEKPYRPEDLINTVNGLLGI